MNPLTNIKNLQKLNQRELELGLTTGKSWHDKYKDSAWIFVGGLPYDLTEGDVICVFSQYGEIVNVNLVRDPKTGKSKGFCFLCYEDQRSTVLTVDNLNGAKVLGRTLRVDHVEEYKKPKDHGDEDEVTQKLRVEGCAPKVESSEEEEEEEEEDPMPVKVKKAKKVKKEKKKKKKRARSSSSSESEDSEDDVHRDVKVKREKHDPGYDRALEGGSFKGRAEGNGRKDREYKESGREKQRNINKDHDSYRNLKDGENNVHGVDERDRRGDRYRATEERGDRGSDRLADSRRDREGYDGRDRDSFDIRDRESNYKRDRDGNDRRDRESYDKRDRDNYDGRGREYNERRDTNNKGRDRDDTDRRDRESNNRSYRDGNNRMDSYDRREKESSDKRGRDSGMRHKDEDRSYRDSDRKNRRDR